MTEDLKAIAIGIFTGAVLCYCLNWAAEYYAYQSHLTALISGAN